MAQATVRTSSGNIASRVKSVGASCAIAAALTYLSLAVPGRVTSVCANLGTPIYCPILAYGFPLPFIADSQAVSPVGSVAGGPLSLGIRSGLTFRHDLNASRGTKVEAVSKCGSCGSCGGCQT
jgi:hypothetical protein